MDKKLYSKIDASTARRESREAVAGFVLKHPELSNDLIALATAIDDKNHFKACWILEIVLERRLSLIVSRLDEFCNSLPTYNHDSALRSIAKICVLCAEEMARNENFLTDAQVRQITESCFDWLISDEKVAAKAYSIKALYETGKRLDWVYPELVPVLRHGFAGHSAAYRSAAKKILSKIG